MNEEFNTEEIIEDTIDPKLQAEIDKKVAELKAADPKLKSVKVFVVDGTDDDDKELYVAYLRQPSFMTFSKYLTAAQKGNQAVALRQLATDCFLAGDRELVDDDSLFLFGLMGQLNQLTEMRSGRLVNLSKPRK